MVRLSAACLGLIALALVPSAFAQDAPAAAAVETAATESAVAAPNAEADDDAELVIVPGKPSRKMIYQFYQQLGSNDFCPQGLVTPRGYSCAEVTYEILDAKGKSLGKCNVPIFKLYRFGFEYVAITYEKLDCSDSKITNRKLAPVLLKELFDPRTRDGTIFRKIGVMGIDQARDLCEVSSDACVLKLFDRESELAFCTKQNLWGVPPRGGPPRFCTGK